MVGWNALPGGGNAMRDTRSLMVVGAKGDKESEAGDQGKGYVFSFSDRAVTDVSFMCCHMGS